MGSETSAARGRRASRSFEQCQEMRTLALRVLPLGLIALTCAVVFATDLVIPLNEDEAPSSGFPEAEALLSMLAPGSGAGSAAPKSGLPPPAAVPTVHPPVPGLPEKVPQECSERCICIEDSSST